METNKNNINRNRQPLTPEDIEKGQNFDSFLKAFHAKTIPFYKKPGFYIASAALGTVIAVGSYFALSSPTPPPATATAFVQAPLRGITVADTIYRLDAASGGTFSYNTGSAIVVPEGAFLTAAGQPATGPVELRYREFHDPAAIFMAGIPMTYDSAGRHYHFESAGMLEITAWQNGQPLKTNPAQPIEVAMASNTPDNRFNVYYLDTTARNWSFIKRDSAIVLAAATDDTSKATPKTTGPAPLRPQLADKKRPSFSIAFDPLEFPELNAYKGLRFEVDEDRTPYNRADRKIQWDDAAISRNSDGRTLTVTFTKDTLQRSYVTYVVVDGKNLTAAMAAYNERFAQYEAARTGKDLNAVRQQQALDNSVEKADRRRLFENNKALRAAMATMRSNVGSKQENQVMRLFVIQDFGVWNSDCPANLPQAEPMAVKLRDSRTNQELSASKFFLVEKGRNAIFTYSVAGMASFQCNSEMDNLLWAVTADGKLATASADALRSLKGRKTADLTMTVHEGVLATPEQTKSVLGL